MVPPNIPQHLQTNEQRAASGGSAIWVRTLFGDSDFSREDVDESYDRLCLPVEEDREIIYGESVFEDAEFSDLSGALTVTRITPPFVLEILSRYPD